VNVELADYPAKALPEKWFYQIISFLRIDDPDGFVGANQTRNWISRAEEHGRHFVLYSGDVLISHAEVLWKEIEHEGHVVDGGWTAQISRSGIGDPAIWRKSRCCCSSCIRQLAENKIPAQLAKGPTRTLQLYRELTKRVLSMRVNQW
jgi:hypothetical protein